MLKIADNEEVSPSAGLISFNGVVMVSLANNAIASSLAASLTGYLSMRHLAESQISSRVAIAFDPGYISKSGKCTPYLGRFWSGCAKMAKHGLYV